MSNILKCLIFILFKIYFIVAVINFIEAQKLDPNITLDFCNGFGFLVILTIVIDWSLFYYKILVPIVQKWIKTSEGHKFQNEISEGKLSQTYNKFMSKWYSSLVINSIVFTSVFIFLLVDTASDRQRFYRQVSTYSDWALEKFKSDFILTIFYLDFHASFKAEFNFVQLGGKL